MLRVYRQIICTYFTLPQVELISSADFYGDTGALYKLNLNLSVIIIVTVISVIHAMTCYTTEPEVCSYRVISQYVY